VCGGVATEPDAGTGALGILGFSANDERVYRTLIAHPGATSIELVGLTGMTRRAVSRALASLLRAELLERIEWRHRRYRVAAPADALRRLLQRTEAELERAVAAVDRLIEEAESNAALDE